MPKVISDKEIESKEHIVSTFGNGGQVILPKRYVGRKVKIITIE